MNKNKKAYALGKRVSVSPYKRYLTSPEGFIRIVDNKRGTIKTSRYIPPKIGSKSLGKFYIETY